MDFLYVDKADMRGATFRYDGILGLGPRARVNTDPKVFVQRLYDQVPSVIKFNMFSIYLGNIRKNESHITFGGYDYSFLRKTPGWSKYSNE